MQFQLITPEATLFSGEAVMVTVPGKEGVFGVLDGHAPLVSTLKAGLITVDLAGKSQKRVVILSGLAEVTPEKTVVLAETAEDCSDLTSSQAAERLAEAKKAKDAAISEGEQKEAAQRLLIAETLAEGLKAA